MASMLGDYVTPVPAQQRLGPQWFSGSADAIFQSLNLIYDEQPDYVAVFGADHVYRMDPAQMLQAHVDSGAGVTVAGIRVPKAQATEFGVIETDASGERIVAFHEKVPEPPTVPDDPEVCYASMGNYIFDTDVLIDALKVDAGDSGSVHDMGRNIIPMLTQIGAAHVYDFARNEVPGALDRDRGYWRDVGTLDSYHDAHMDLVSVHPVFNLYNRRWPILSAVNSLPPAKIVEGGQAWESLLGAGSIVAGATVDRSVVSTNVMIRPGAHVAGSVLMPGVQIGRDAVISGAILDKNVVVPDGARIGVDPDEDAARYTVTPGGVVVLGKGEAVH
jgi:glucose-1-phosphate adenylyltransferase